MELQIKTVSPNNDIKLSIGDIVQVENDFYMVMLLDDGFQLVQIDCCHGYVLTCAHESLEGLTEEVNGITKLVPGENYLPADRVKLILEYTKEG